MITLSKRLHVVVKETSFLSDTALKVKQSYKGKMCAFVIFKKTHFPDSNLNSFPCLHQKSSNGLLVIS